MVCISSQGAEKSQPKPSPPASVAQPREQVWSELLDAGQNVRYWSLLAGQSQDTERIWKYLIAGSGIAAIALPWLLRDFQKAKVIIGFCELAAVVAFAVSIYGLLCTSPNYQELSGLEKQWSSLETQWDALFHNVESLPVDQAKATIANLLTQRQDIENREPSETDHDIMRQAFVYEMHRMDQDAFRAIKYTKPYQRSTVAIAATERKAVVHLPLVPALSFVRLDRLKPPGPTHFSFSIAIARRLTASRMQPARLWHGLPTIAMRRPHDSKRARSSDDDRAQCGSAACLLPPPPRRTIFLSLPGPSMRRYRQIPDVPNLQSSFCILQSALFNLQCPANHLFTRSLLHLFIPRPTFAVCLFPSPRPFRYLRPSAFICGFVPCPSSFCLHSPCIVVSL